MENTPSNVGFSHLSVLAQTQVWFIWWTIYMYFNILTKTQLLLPQASLYKEVDVPEWYVWKPKHSFPGVFGWKKETRRANIKWAFIFERSSANGLLTLWSPGWSCFILKWGEHNRLGVPRGEWSNLWKFLKTYQRWDFPNVKQGWERKQSHLGSNIPGSNKTQLSRQNPSLRSR